ncbi:PP2C family protein-serine/threonine phosphatase [Oligoflexus tunisiensis]|uniref:PP2C family protein-serine/threonine phosphatase n=1 Tax=Oligoflexus tunisiensis TaxID=708132 RepID=UPI000A9EC2E5|nr:PP2C family protein-serine/threonine phosphatase [Oligoflexus tunisiensis]
MNIRFPRKWNIHISPLRWILIQALCFFSFFIFSQTQLALDLQRSLTAPLNFKFRILMNKSPRLDPRIKIYAFDDSTLDYVGREDLSIGEWSRMFEGMAAAEPAGIYIDKFFATPEKLDEEYKLFEEIVKKLPVPLVVDVWFTGKAVVGRHALPLDLPQFDPSRQALPSVNWDEALRWLPVTPGFLYGPHKSIMPLLQHLGHAIYLGQGEVQPLLRPQRDRVVPHWTLVGANRYTLGDQKLLINDREVPLTDRQTVLVNFLDLAQLQPETRSLRSTVHRLRKGVPLTEFRIPRRPPLQKGQYIMILPAMFTANTDFVNTPLGYSPGGYLMVAMLNSTLTGQWLHPYPATGLTLLVLSLIGGILGVLASPVLWTSGLMLGNAVIACVSLFCFSHLSVVIPWELLIGSFSASAFFTFASELHLRILSEHDEKGRREAMHQAAQAVQEALLPEMSHLPGINVAAHYKAADATGGDWFGIYPTADAQRIFIFVGDVTGHGFSSALLTGVVSGAIKTLIKDPATSTGDPGLILKDMARSINDLVYRTGSKASRSMTMTFACLDLSTHICHFLNGGHCPPYRLQAGKVNPLVARGDILGFGEHFRGEPKKIELRPGDLLFFYTDGLLENEGPAGEHLKARDVWDCLKNSDQSVEDMVRSILARGQAVWKNHPAADDCTFFIVRYRGRSPLDLDGFRGETGAA